MRASIAAYNDGFVGTEHDPSKACGCSWRVKQRRFAMVLSITTDMRGPARRKVCSGPRLESHEQGEVTAAWTDCVALSL